MDANGEWFEIYNMTFAPIDIGGWVVRDSAASGVRPSHLLPSPTVIPPGTFFVFGNTTNTTTNGGVPVNYAYGAAMQFANSLDRLQILKPDPVGTVVISNPSPNPGTYTLIDEAYYQNPATSAQNGISRERISILNNSTLAHDNVDGLDWQDAAVTDVYGSGGRGTPGAQGGTTLPVELVAFDVRTDGTSARLAWTTASETNNLGFYVEHQTGETWTERRFVAGRGTTTERHDYAFSVDGLTAGRHTFRIRQVDTDGTVHLSAPVSVAVGVEGETVRLTMLGSRAFRIETSAPESVNAAVFDVLGRMVLRERMDVSGTREVPIPAALAAGTYVVRVEGARAAAARTFTVR